MGRRFIVAHQCIGLGGTLLGAGAGCDPVVDDAVAALGPEKPGVPPGPTHRPGQPCLLCHDGSLFHPHQFTVAGTVFQRTDTVDPAVGVQVDLTDIRGAVTTVTANMAGNFYLTPAQYDPTFPLQVSLRSGSTLVAMETLIEGNGTVEPNGGCASCHADPAGPSSPGHVAVALPDGGAPPL